MDMQHITKIIFATELFTQGVPQTHIAIRLGVNRDTVRLWLKGVAKLGLPVFLEHYQSAKKGNRKRRKLTDGLKNLIYAIREGE